MLSHYTTFPRDLAVGVAFGSVAAGLPQASLGAAIALAVGIGIQNFPEGIAVAMPLRAEGMGRLKSFWFGQLSALVEPVAAMTGAALVVVAAPILPYALSFAAGAMIYVVVEELIPEAERAGQCRPRDGEPDDRLRHDDDPRRRPGLTFGRTYFSQPRAAASVNP